MSGNPATVISEKNFMQEVTIPLVPVSSNRQKKASPVLWNGRSGSSPKRTKSLLPAAKLSACLSLLQPIKAASSPTQPKQRHPFQTLQCPVPAEPHGHRRHSLAAPSTAPAAEPASSSDRREFTRQEEKHTDETPKIHSAKAALGVLLLLRAKGIRLQTILPKI